MKKFGSKKYFLAVILTFLLLFNVLLFLLTKKSNRNDAFWVAYGFVMFSFVALFITSFVSKEGKTGIAFIHPALTVVGLYLLIVFFLALIVFFIPSISLKTVLVMMILVTGISLVVYFFALMNRDLIKRESIKSTMMFKITDVYPVLEKIKNSSSDVTLKQQLDEMMALALNAIEVESDNILVLDKRIFEYVQFVEKNVRRGEMNNVYHNLNKVKELFKLREQSIIKKN